MIRYTPVLAFGWVGTYATAEQGDVFPISTPRALAPGEKDYATAWLKGHMQMGDRHLYPGDVSQKTPGLPAGNHVMLAVEPTEWLCFMAGRNGGRVPRLMPIRLAVGEALTLPANTNALVAVGALDKAPNGASVAVGKKVAEVKAIEDTWLIVFGG